MQARTELQAQLQSERENSRELRGQILRYESGQNASKDAREKRLQEELQKWQNEAEKYKDAVASIEANIRHAETRENQALKQVKAANEELAVQSRKLEGALRSGVCNNGRRKKTPSD